MDFISFPSTFDYLDTSFLFLKQKSTTLDFTFQISVDLHYNMGSQISPILSLSGKERIKGHSHYWWVAIRQTDKINCTAKTHIPLHLQVKPSKLAFLDLQSTCSTGSLRWKSWKIGTLSKNELLILHLEAKMVAETLLETFQYDIPKFYQTYLALMSQNRSCL